VVAAADPTQQRVLVLVMLVLVLLFVCAALIIGLR
jgi:hypothetical protein